MLLKNFKEASEFIYDFVIIGAGPAGISLALQLEKKDKKVLIIEAGGEEISEKSQNLYKGKIVGDNYFPLDSARLRYLGGSSGHWGGNCFDIEDFNFANWPISKNDLFTFLTDAKKILNLEGSFNRKKKLFQNFEDINSLKSYVRFGEKYDDHLKKSKNIFLLLESPLLSIIPQKDNPRKVDQIKILYANKSIKNIKIKNLILASGGIENSRLLLWSKILAKNSFLQDLPIGNYWREHPTGIVAQYVLNKKFKNTPFNSFELLQNYLDENHIVTSYDFIKKENITTTRLTFNTYPKVKNKTFKHYIKDLVCIAPNFGKKIVESFIDNNPVHCHGYISASGEQSLDYKNRVTLDTEKDSLGIPKVKLEWRIKEDVYNSFKISLENLGREFIEKDIGRIGIDRQVYDNSFNKLDDIFANYHHMGGTVIGDNPKTSVVDKNLKVHKVDNLFISGSSVFSKSGTANPTLYIVMLSLRLGNYLAKNRV